MECIHAPDDEDSLNLLIYDCLLKIKDEPCLKIILRSCERDYDDFIRRYFQNI